MKINRVSETNVAPSWAFGSQSLDKFEENKSVMRSDVERINATEKGKVTDAVLAKECEAIEKCASSGKTYHYNSTWEPKAIEHLKEYASVCGLEKIEGVDPTSLIKEMNAIEKEASNSRMTKTASVESKGKLVLEDPFHFDKHADVSHMEKAKWQDVKKQAEMSDAPSMLSGAVKPLRGGEDYLKSSTPKLAINQNSIKNPDAIKQLADSKSIDVGERLKAERLAKIEERKQAHKEWEANLVKSMEHKDIVPKGNVFPTETLNAQSGLNTPSSKMGVYAKFDPNSIPEKTEGERIRESRKEWTKSIQRPEKVKEDFKMNSDTRAGVSDLFAEELKKRIK